MDDRLKQLVEELGVAISNTLSASEQIQGLIAEIRDGGYDLSLLFNATIAIAKRNGDMADLQPRRSAKVEFRLDPQDVQFLKSMHISVNG